MPRPAPWSPALARALLLTGLLAGLLGGCGTGGPGGRAATTASGPPTVPADAAGEVLLSRMQCTACHAAPAPVEARLRPLAAPPLDDVGARLAPEWLDAWLAAPHALRPGTRMPDLLAALPEHDREATRTELVHYLASLGGPFEAEAGWRDAWDPLAGRALHDTVGCRACHGDELLGRDLAAMTDLSRLTAFLRDPLHWRPSGEMPDLALTETEARHLASYLLREQLAAGPTGRAEGPGLRREFFPFERDLSELPDLEGLWPARTDVVREVTCDDIQRGDRFALRFRGEVRLPGGATELWVVSDDGSRVSVAGEVVVDHDGLHSPSRAAGTVAAEAGWHPIEILFFEHEGGAELRAGLVEDGVDRPFGPDDLRSVQPRWGPPESGFELDPRLASRGRRAFTELGCVACHGDPGGEVGRRSPVPPRPPRVPDLLALADKVRDLPGCLAPTPGAGVPDFHLDDAERAALATAVADAPNLLRPLEPAAEVDLTVRRLGCIACHARDGHPGPRGEAAARFTSDEDLGDEGRLPPTLTGVGRKLRPDWLERVLVDGASVRPYMHARMPRFGGDNVGHLVQAFALADGAPVDAGPPAFDAGLVAAGRALTGRGGLSCISCHTTHGHASMGIPGLDLGSMGERLRPAWFAHWMREPLAVRPGTRMPTFFDEGRSVKRDVLDGDAAAQIDALYRYLSLGDAMPLPPGLVVDGAAYEVVPVDGPRYVGAFMDGLSARVLAVGFPEKVAAAYDREHARLALLWKGDFFDAEGTWRGRAGQLEVPPSDEVLELPPGQAVAALAAEDDPWPEHGDWLHGGHVRTGSGPAFALDLGRWRVDTAGAPGGGVGMEPLNEARVLEGVSARFGPDGGVVVRTMEVVHDSGPLVWRVALSDELRGDAPGVFVATGGVRYTVTGGRAWIHAVDGRDELRIALPAAGTGERVEVEVSW